MACLIETDYQIKSGPYEKDYLFDLALLRLQLEICAEVEKKKHDCVIIFVINKERVLQMANYFT